jgi:hypothetical protein
MRRLDLVLIALLTLAAPAAFCVDGVSDSCEDFLRFYGAAKSLSAPEKSKLFNETVYKSNPLYYEYRYSDWKSMGRDPEQELRKEIEGFESIRGQFVVLHQTIPQRLDAAASSFKKRFPDFKLDNEIILVHSLGLADGTKREIAGKNRFVIGLDMIAQYHEYEDQTAFFHHELFHFYHGQHYAQTRAMYSHLWGEGMAVYVSQALNPSATLKEISLANANVNLPERVDPFLSKIAADLLANFESTDWQYHTKYFAVLSKDPLIPPRAGYYIGYLLAQRLAKQYTLEQLVRMQNDQFAPKLRAELEKMAQGK